MHQAKRNFILIATLFSNKLMESLSCSSIFCNIVGYHQTCKPLLIQVQLVLFIDKFPIQVASSFNSTSYDTPYRIM